MDSDAGREQYRDPQASAELAAFDEVLGALAAALDVRAVLPQVSAIVMRVLPHDRMFVAIHTGAAGTVEGASNEDGPTFDRLQLTEHPPGAGANRIIADLTRESLGIADPPDLQEGFIAAGYRAFMGVTMAARDQLCSVVFMSKAVGAFTTQHLTIAGRVAAHLALAVSHEQLGEAVRRVAEAQGRAERLEMRVKALSDQLDSRTGYGKVIGVSRAWQDVLKQAAQVAATDTTVLVTGESGTGKEVVARFIHRASPRRSGPYVGLNCAALPDQLLEAELFGYERGAFTGAQQSKPGQIEVAAGGVLFLDEVGELSPGAQAKLLRVLQEREFSRLGSTKVLRANVRVIAATNRDLSKAIERGEFREDLFYRLQVFDIKLPPLRERREDILPLSEAFLEEIGRSFGRPPAGLTREARHALVERNWPGNARELRNALERAAILCDGGLITKDHLPAAMAAPTPGSGTTELSAMEKDAIADVMKAVKGNKAEAARRLGVTRQQLYFRLRKYGLM